MASAPMSLENQIQCPICNDYFKDPVVLDCGHSFCQGCIEFCENIDDIVSLKCSVCNAKYQKGDFRRNWQLASLVEQIKLLLLNQKNPEKEFDLCHKEKNCLFCKEDEKIICWFCERSPEHKGHSILPLQEAAQQYKGKFCDCLEILRKEREEILAYKADTENQCQGLLEQTEAAKQKTVAEFRQLSQFLEEEEKLQLGRMEEVEKEIARKRDEQLAKISQEFSSLESLIQDMEEKEQQPAIEFLQDFKSTLQRYEGKQKFEKSVAFPPELNRKIQSICDNTFPKAALKQLKGMEETWFDSVQSTDNRVTRVVPPIYFEPYETKCTAKLTLDPDTAHPQLVLSEDRKSVRHEDKYQHLPDNPERFDTCTAVLGYEGFTSGQLIFEVIVGSASRWAVGVAKKSVKRKGWITLSPKGGIWAVGKWADGYWAFTTHQRPHPSLNGKPKRIRVSLDYHKGHVAFFDADTRAILYEFSNTSFSGEALQPFFQVYDKGHISLSL
ncbi:tripartite motif-containing protein 10-like [Eublepharis macularius]|uniref:Tripartite motif-containing protein 10-like n=1 Tax=Eublepharis macularius TaxID=481883 RepID=A0AA97J5M3_EUBMA|nr:tripartite motif-containing protein 10-like [Eublepharis macularius]XP_054831877.1 tripartite motif-containing protein 10-like [Eublepharis macularius]XP_054831878.1 tripartite motif-containing protein 10-like [Eublepharis macularius]